MKAFDFLHPVLSSEDAVAFEKSLFGGDEGKEWTAMNQAGAAIARQALLDVRETLGDDPISSMLVLVGKGHNGGDAIIAARHLLNRFPRAEVKLLFPFGLSRIRPLVQRCLDDMQASHGTQLRYLSLRTNAVGKQLEGFVGEGDIDLCLDGILGMQFRPPLREPLRELIDWVNQRESIRCRIAVDVPSGVGDSSDKEPFRADFTYATGIAKQGLFEDDNRKSVGRIRYLDLGFFSGERVPSHARIITPSILSFRRELRKAQAHKKTFGHLFVVGGSATMPGAILMTVQAALKSGVGLVTAFVPESIAAEAAVRTPEAMWVPLPLIPDDGGLALEGLDRIRRLAGRSTGWVLGPGMGKHPESGTLLEEILKLGEAPVLLDADALSPELVQRDRGGRPCVITPHAGEFNRLLERPLNETVESEEVEALAGKHGCICLLKGSPTLISDGDGLAYHCAGGPILARGGSGDILSGLIGGRISIPGTDALQGALEGAAWQGSAADALARSAGQASAMATDILDFL